MTRVSCLLLLAAGYADAAAQQPAPPRVVEGRAIVAGEPAVVTAVEVDVEDLAGDAVASAVARAIGGDANAAVQAIEGGNLGIFVGESGAGRPFAVQILGGAAPGEAEAGPARQVPYIGVVASPLQPAVRAQTALPEEIGLAVDFVSPGSPAEKAGLKPFDVLAKYDDQILCAPVQLSALVKRTGTGNKATLTVIRAGKEMPVEVTVGEHASTPITVQGMQLPGGGVWQGGGAGDQGQQRMILEQLRSRIPALQNPPPAIPAAPPGLPALPVPPGGAPGNRRFLFVNPQGTAQSQSTSVFANDEGQVILRETNGVRTVTILDAAGKQQYAGPFAPGDIEKVPAELRGRVEQAIGSAGPGIWSEAPAGPPAASSVPNQLGAPAPAAPPAPTPEKKIDL